MHTYSIDDLHPQYISDENGDIKSVIIPIDRYQKLIAILKQQALPVSENIPNAETIAAIQDPESEPVDDLRAWMHENG